MLAGIVEYLRSCSWQQCHRRTCESSGRCPTRLHHQRALCEARYQQHPHRPAAQSVQACAQGCPHDVRAQGGSLRRHVRVRQHATRSGRREDIGCDGWFGQQLYHPSLPAAEHRRESVLRERFRLSRIEAIDRYSARQASRRNRCRKILRRHSGRSSGGVAYRRAEPSCLHGSCRHCCYPILSGRSSGKVRRAGTERRADSTSSARADQVYHPRRISGTQPTELQQVRSASDERHQCIESTRREGDDEGKRCRG